MCYVIEITINHAGGGDDALVIDGFVEFDKKHQRVLHYNTEVEVIGASFLEEVGSFPVFVWTIILDLVGTTTIRSCG